MKQDIYDFVKEWIEADKTADEVGSLRCADLAVWIKRLREAGYFEYKMPAYQCSTTNFTSWCESTPSNCRFIVFDETWCRGNFNYFFFNTEQDKTLFILKWS